MRGWKKVDNKFYTVKEAAEITGLAEQVIRNYLSLGKIKGEKVYNSTVISKEELEKYIKVD